MSRIDRSGIIVECVKGDIAAQDDMAAVVNAANAELSHGGGVSGALHRAAGPELEAESIRLGPIRPAEAVITDAYRLPNRRVIHCLGPVYGVDEPSDALLASCYRNALSVAEEDGLESIAFPAISTGIFGYPRADAAEIAFRAIRAALPNLNAVRHIRFVLHDDESLALHERLMQRVLGD